MRVLELYLLLLLLYPGLSVSGQEETLQLLHLHEPNPPSISVSVSPTDLPAVASSVLAVESWLKTHVLAHFPSTNISTIVVGRGIPCSKHHDHLWKSVLPSMRNLHYSLVRWGLVKEIKISSFLSFDCSLHMTSITTRRLSSMTFPPYPFAPVPDGSFSFPPDASPDVIPANPPDSNSMVPPPPLCVAGAAPAPAPGGREEKKGGLWCVAKPTVPNEKLQEAMDYACGEGGADCEEIMPNGKCYNPDNLVAHASYAFNSYWQKTKQTGGSCSFDGTALLINSDPSFLQCQFMLS